MLSLFVLLNMNPLCFNFILVYFDVVSLFKTKLNYMLDLHRKSVTLHMGPQLIFSTRSRLKIGKTHQSISRMLSLHGQAVSKVNLIRKFLCKSLCSPFTDYRQKCSWKIFLTGLKTSRISLNYWLKICYTLLHSNNCSFPS